MNLAKAKVPRTIGFTLLILMGCKSVDPESHFMGSFSPASPELVMQRRDRIDRYIEAHPELTERQRALLHSGVVGEGLAKEQVRLLLWRDPDKIEQGSLKYGADEMWFYRGPKWNDYYYFRGDVLIKIDHKR